MFLTELSPFLKELSQQPIAFLGGLASGFLRLSLADDPVKSWLDQQTGSAVYPSATTDTGNGSGPQSISID
ncbi:MAG: hypothetical protein KME13_00885 [Myxacorys californica WJT36-NPBG1]|jgi:hypothetical protein|nr:hypothetical protein [Myxacorys californica WJT36-NPBG1]